MNAHVTKWIGWTGCLLGLPLVGVWSTGGNMTRYFEFPPTTRYVEPVTFSWIVFMVLSAGIVAVVLPFILRWRRTENMGKVPVAASFPWWGWLALAVNLASWVIAWNRYPAWAAFQKHTFFPLWFTYIVVVNALTLRRSGRCMMTSRPGYFIALFFFSAVFWWFFEYLNRFVQNWSYVEIENFTRWEYFNMATLSFSTVLPAVRGTRDWLLTFPRLEKAFKNFAPFNLAGKKTAYRVILVLALAGLTGIGRWPHLLYPMLWVAPLLLIVGWQGSRGASTVFTPTLQGDWSGIVAAALAALICGWFWEMWNVFSMAKWVYHVPFVHRFLVFEMPVIGFSGYLPFGLECIVIADLVSPWFKIKEGEGVA